MTSFQGFDPAAMAPQEETTADVLMYELLMAETEAQAHLDAMNMGEGAENYGSEGFGQTPADLQGMPMGAMQPPAGPSGMGPMGPMGPMDPMGMGAGMGAGPGMQPPAGPGMDTGAVPSVGPLDLEEPQAPGNEDAVTAAMLDQELNQQGTRDQFQDRNMQKNRQGRLAHLRGYQE